MRGWKTLAGAVLFGAGSIVRALGYTELGDVLEGVGGALGLIGVGHKIDKAADQAAP